MATDIGFYHCTRAPALDVAARLAAKAFGSGQRLLLLGAPGRLEELDRLLWTFDEASFLPHAITGALEDAEQPILLAPDMGEAPPANGARLLLLLETGLSPGFENFDRVLNLFEDGGAAHERARADWKALQARDGLQRSYWQQKESGGWDRRA
ncbi:DNA polymerase III subunit chi [Sandaracinobacter sp. RS1-74]|uniref:DNA polymerase III subunit chi n=1 Tax=Sandaracinobacteroides sayramensis TaxID=2913411 RepID=UPI001EDB948D|nr:DNA polymerase III subunit chi [Sandaracinobacteroides sayramensis]MCG2840706.1 DNA polymerase III subunit chi [Sandaracinobacteroides sayramensis]